MPNNIIITGAPRMGKSILLERILAEVNPIHGLLAKEILQKGERVGFEFVTSEGYREPFAHVNSASDVRIGKYRVEEYALDRAALSLQGTFPQNAVLYIDEIGEMQLYSGEFRLLARRFLNAENVCIATLSAVFDDPFITQIREREDVRLFELTEENRDKLYQRVLEEITNYQKIYI